MKKTYIIPSTDMVQVELQNMIALSNGALSFTTDEQGSGDLIEQDAVSSAMGRSTSVWGDDEE